MQEEITGNASGSLTRGDSLLASDLAYIGTRAESGGETYLVYPSVALPRFLIPARDRAGKEFILRLMSADRGALGACMRYMLTLPGGVPFLSSVVFRERVRVTDPAHKLRLLIVRNWRAAGCESEPSPSELFVTKFCQRVVQPHTKVLFFVTYRGKPLCILKMMRSVAYNEKLRKEKEAQERAPAVGIVSSLPVLFEGYVADRYIYAEPPLLQAVPLSRTLARKHANDIIAFIRSFPTSGTVVARKAASFLTPFLPVSEPKLTPLITFLRESDAILELGFTHGDLGTPNVLKQDGQLFVIDWERSGERPFRFIDAVAFFARLKRVADVFDWRARARPLLLAHLDITPEVADALFAIHVIHSILYKRHQDKYRQLLLKRPWESAGYKL